MHQILQRVIPREIAEDEKNLILIRDTVKGNLNRAVRRGERATRGCTAFIEEGGYAPNLFVMGRSLGSIPAVEIAYHYQDELEGLIIESGSANNFHRLWGYLDALEIERLSDEKFLNKEKVKAVLIPTCIIHGEIDQILPVQEGSALYENSGAADKEILIISGAGHNDLMVEGQEQYFSKIEKFVSTHATSGR